MFINVSVMCFAFTMVFKTKTKVMAWIGDNSFEFYLFHLANIQIFCKLITINQYLYTVSVFVGTFVTVHIFLSIKDTNHFIH